MKTGLNCEQSFDEWSREFERNVTCTVVQLFYDTSGCSGAEYTMLHETLGFILEEAGISPEILYLFEFLFEDDKPGMGDDEHASEKL